jgi:hypothetical protein
MRETEARLRADIHRSHNRVILWVAGLIAAQVPLFTSCSGFCHRFSRKTERKS